MLDFDVYVPEVQMMLQELVLTRLKLKEVPGFSTSRFGQFWELQSKADLLSLGHRSWTRVQDTGFRNAYCDILFFVLSMPCKLNLHLRAHSRQLAPQSS